MALIGELNEFHKTRRRGLRRRKRNHHYVQKYMEIDKGKDSKIVAKHRICFICYDFMFLKSSKLAQQIGCCAKSMAISVKKSEWLRVSLRQNTKKNTWT